MRQLGHLVQKDRPAVRLLEITLAGFDCSGEGPFSCPNNSESIVPSGMAPQFTAIYLLCLRAE